jgi:hypothetical protein
MVLFAHSSAPSTRAQSHLLLVPPLPLFKLALPLPQSLRALQEFLLPRSAPTPMVKRSRTTLSAVNLTRTSVRTRVQMPLTLTWIVCLPVTPQPRLAVLHLPTLAVLKVADLAHVTSRTAWEASPSLAATTMSPVWLPLRVHHRRRHHLSARPRADRLAPQELHRRARPQPPHPPQPQPRATCALLWTLRISPTPTEMSTPSSASLTQTLAPLQTPRLPTPTPTA